MISTGQQESAAKADADGAAAYEDASRFLVQAAFGGGPSDIGEVVADGMEGWFARQTALPPRSLAARYQTASRNTRHFVHPLFWEGAIHGEDQLRQRVAYALSQIVVVSLEEAAQWPDLFVAYADILQEEAFGNYEDLISRVTYAPAMGRYLDHLGNEKADPDTGSAPDENYARELMQLFTIGLVPLRPDGRPSGDADTYGPEDVEGLAAILTGLNWPGLAKFRGRPPGAGDPRRFGRMVGYPEAHEQGVKRFLGYQAEGPDVEKAVDGALAHLLAHPNVPPFVCRRLIQLLVTSNPAPRYVVRVAKAYRTGRHALPSGEAVGQGRRGDMTAVLAAILFDPEARRQGRLRDPGFGRLREPSSRYLHMVRAFRREWDDGSPLRRLKNVTTIGSPRAFGEQPWAAPSVFGVFPPGHVSAGSEAAASGLVSPEAQTVNASTTAGYLNFLSRSAGRGGDPLLSPDLSVLADAAEEPAAMTAILNRRLLHGAAPPETLARIEGALSLVKVRANGKGRAKDLDKRVVLGLMMALTTPSFAVQR